MCVNMVYHGFLFPERAEAAQVTIDANVNVTTTSHLQTGSQTVFIDDQTGYKFFRDEPGYCVYRKTTDGGETWSGTTTVDVQTDCLQITVWYDKWTPNATTSSISGSSSIHIATLDNSSDDIWYNRLDTNGDTLLMGDTPVSMLTGSAQGGTTLATGENYVSITRATNGTIYALSNDGSGVSDSFVVECTRTCSTAANWTETGTNPLDTTSSDQNILVPISEHDVMIVQRDVSRNAVRYRIWDDSASSWGSGWIDLGAGAVNTTYDIGMALAVSSTTPGNVYLAYIANNDTLGTNDEIRTRKFENRVWATTTTLAATTTGGITNVAIGLDAANDNVYVAYTTRTTAATVNSGRVYWQMATSSMGSWGPINGPINTTADDLYGIDLNIVSDQRLYVSWYGATPDDIFGDTIADIFPGVNASTSGSQATSTLASTTNFYIGGKFILYNTYRDRDISGITITENGSVDAESDLNNIRLLYETDTSAPANCASESYSGAESQFGSTDTNGFSGVNGVSSFTGTTVTVSTTTALCVYVVMDVLDSADSSSTINISIANPTTDVTVTNDTAAPNTAQDLTGSSTILNDTATLVHFHWRNDNGSETLATSKTAGIENTALTSMRQSSTTRLRIGISNEGSSSTPAMQYRLEYASNPGSCASATPWIDVGAAGGDFDMSDSLNLTDGANTTNIAVASGGVSDANTSYLASNGGVKDTSSQTGNIVLTRTEYVDLEYSIVASTSAVEGNTYCFRVTNQGTPLAAYDQYPRANIAADVLVTIATSSQIATTSVPTTTFYVGSAFVITENTATRTVDGITITETGTVDAQNSLDNIRLRYDLDTTVPYDCAGESYTVSDTQYGTTDTDGFSAANGSSTFTGSVTISTTSTMCLYVVVDVTGTAQNDETINIVMENASQYLVVSNGGSVSPSITRDMNGSTTLKGAILTQTHYHWRADNGTEAGATSLTSGVQDTAITNVAQTTPVRLRLQVSNEGTVAAASTTLRLEYGAKISTCSTVTSWVDVGESGGTFDMFNSSNLTDGANTTNIAIASGGVTDENTTFLTPNAGVKDTSSQVATATPTSTQFMEVEYAIQQTASAGFDITYCFRVSNGGTALNVYSVYPELTTSPKRDFEIQRNTVNFSGTSTTLVAGVNYTAPSASTSAFVRITNTHHTGAGDSSAGGSQNAVDTSAYILNPSNLTTSFTIARPAGAAATTTRVSWEIIEFIGGADTDNEIKVRQQGFITYGTTATTATATAATGIANDAKVVVFITGQGNPDTGLLDYNTGQSTSNWASSSNQAVFTRGEANGDASIVSYAVVEFTGPNWAIQRVQHTYNAAGVTETEAITAVNSLSRTFLHTQKTAGAGLQGTDEFGAEVWLSSIGQLSFVLQSGATSPALQTSVAWVIENLQTADGAMEVTRTNNTINGDTIEPVAYSISITKTLSDITNASIFVNNRAAGTGTTFPQPILGATIASTTHYELWRSDTTTNGVTYRTEIVEWPTAGLAISQNYYRFYVDNNATLPTDPWPSGGTDLGENTALTASDEPLGEGERIRIRMSLHVANATLPMTTKSFRLQYGQMVSTCSAISPSNWITLGNNASSTVWRGYAATGTTDGTNLSVNPPTGGDLLLSVSDVAGTLEEINDSAANPFAVLETEDFEYDWIVEQNGAVGETFYCFRVVESDGTVLARYDNYPQIRTASFLPRTQNWRWYDDEYNATPTTTLAAENVAPIDISNSSTLKLRVTVKETKNIARDDVRFKLQYSEYSDFSQTFDVVATSTCTATSTWCYADGAGIDNAVISTTTLSDADTCALGVGDGCGTHNESSNVLTGFRHENNAATEYEFTIKSAAPRVNRVYYFRLYDVVQDVAVTANTSETYPSLVTQGAQLIFTTSGLATSTVVEGVTLDVASTPSSIAFGTLPNATQLEAGHRLTVDTNGTQGHQIFMMSTGNFMTSGGGIIQPVTGTNQSPSAWNTGCSITASSCYGYHAGDDILEGGSTRFTADDTYARLSTTTLEEISHSSLPAAGDTTDVIYRVFVRSTQDAGQYQSTIRYVSVPIF